MEYDGHLVETAIDPTSKFHVADLVLALFSLIWFGDRVAARLLVGLANPNLLKLCLRNTQ